MEDESGMQGNETQYTLTDARERPSRRRLVIGVVVVALLVVAGALYFMRGQFQAG